MKINTYATDLQVLPESGREKHDFLKWVHNKGHHAHVVHSNVPGQDWNGKYFYEIAFRSDLKEELITYMKNIGEK